MTSRSGFPAISGNASPEQVAATVNRLNRGKFNASVDVTLTANAASTVVTDERIGIGSVLLFDPVTAHAATELANGTLYAASVGRGNGAVTLTHANNSQTDRTFHMLVIGG